MDFEFGMIPVALLRKFSGPAALSLCAAVVNMATTILVVRICGAASYAEYMIDLSIIALTLLILEVIPSSYSVYKIQEDSLWRKVVERQLIVTGVMLAPIVYFLGYSTPLFHAFSGWIVLYAVTQVSKRYLDLTLQSSGRLKDFMWVELSSSVVRFVLVIAGSAVGFDQSFLIWGALAVSVLVAQLIALLRRPGLLSSAIEESSGEYSANNSVARNGRSVFLQLLPYYPAIALRRVKDNLLPLVGGWVLGSKEQLGLVMLAYRGLLFANGQVRIFEALLSHRATLRDVTAIPFRSKVAIACVAQAAAILASLLLIALTGQGSKPFALAALVSLLAWPMVFYTMERANALSKFQASRINYGLVAYIIVVLMGANLMTSIPIASLYAFVSLFLLAEVALYVTTKVNDKG